MAEFYFSVNISNEMSLCVAPLTRRRLESSGQEIEDEGGYYLFEKRGSGERAEIDVIAHIVSEEAAFRMRDLLGMD